MPTIGHYPKLYRDAIDALSVLPVRVLVTVGRECDPAELGPVAPNVHVARWIPQSDVLAHAAAIVSHGGSGTVTGSLAAGVPAVVVPFIADQFHNARRVAELGAGIALEAGDIVRLPDAVRCIAGGRELSRGRAPCRCGDACAADRRHRDGDPEGGSPLA